MSRRPITLMVNALLVLMGALLGIAINYATSQTGEPPLVFRWLQRWSLPLVGIILVLLVAGQAWLWWLERPIPAKRLWTGRRPPFPGLEAFTEQDAGVFFGRDTESDELLERLHPTLPERAHRFVAVIGPSGVGKSSLVHAGLLPRLAHRRARWIVVPSLVPEDQPTRNLARSLALMLPGCSANDLEQQLADAGDPSGLLGRIQHLRAAHGGRSVSVLLIIDQAEELLTLTGARERDAFLALLRDALRADEKLWVVATLRSEFLTGFLAAGFVDLFHQPVTVGTLNRAALFQVIERPAAAAGLGFAPGLVGRMVDESGGGEALPLLAYTLLALYLQVGPGGTVSVEAYQRLGGVAGALARQADKVTAELRAADSTAPVEATLLKFVTLDQAEPTRRRVWRSILSDDERVVVDAFVAARLLTSDAAGDDAVLQVTHEALFGYWPPLRQAVAASAEDLRRRAELERWASDWVGSDRQDAYLLRDERLKTAQQWAIAQADLLEELPLVREFLDRSARMDQAALERLSEAIARRALAGIDQDPEHSLLLALAAVQECAPTPLAHRALLAALGTTHVRGVLAGHHNGLASVAWSPDGRRLATTSSDHTARIWAVEHGGELLVLPHREGVRGVAWSPDGQRLATTSNDRMTRIWDAEHGTQLLVLRGHTDTVLGVAWSPDGQRLATASYDHTARIWDVEHGGELLVLPHREGVRGVAWSPDGQRLATASHDRTVRIWDPQDGGELLVLRGHTDMVMGVAWSPDGQRLATASNDHTARIWDVEHGGELLVLRGHTEVVRGVAWSPDGQRLATASHDRTACIWDARHGTQLTILRGHPEAVVAVAWSPGSQHLATASYDRTARIWDTQHATELLVLQGHTNAVQEVAWSPDGQRLATASPDRTARIWDAQHGTELLVLRGHTDIVMGVAWSPDGSRLATASYDRTARIWDALHGAELLVLHGHTEGVRGVVWSPDGERLATISNDPTVLVWHAQRGTQLLALRGHREEVWGVAWSPDSQRLATASHDRSTRIWDVQDGSELLVLHGHKDAVLGVAWSPDSQRLATASHDRTTRIWDVQDGSELLVLHGHEDAVRGVAWSPDGHRLATISRDGTARIWDAQRGSQVTILAVHENWGESVAWSPDGRRLATASRDHTARVWDADVTLEAVVARARQRVLRSLTDEERRLVLLPELSTAR